MSTTKPSVGAAVPVSTDADPSLRITHEFNEFVKIWKAFGKLVDARDVDAMNRTLVDMRIQHARMEVQRYDLMYILSSQGTTANAKHLYDLSTLTTMCASVMARITDCENTWSEVIADVGGRDVPYVGGADDDDDGTSTNGDTGALPSSDDAVPKIVLYSMEGCPACINFRPVWNKFIAKLDARGLEHHEVVYQINPELCTQANVTAFPTILLMRIIDDKPTVVEYDGGPSVNGLLTFIDKHADV